MLGPMGPLVFTPVMFFSDRDEMTESSRIPVARLSGGTRGELVVIMETEDSEDWWRVDFHIESNSEYEATGPNLIRSALCMCFDFLPDGPH